MADHAPPHRQAVEPGLLRVLIAGASGLVGGRLATFLRTAGHRVETLVRRPPQPGQSEIRWDPAHRQMEAGALEGVDAVVNLCGEGIAAGRWTPARKEALRASRVNSTHLLSEALAQLNRPPKVFISASAIGYYGSYRADAVDETSPAGNDFLAELCQQWEAATQTVRDAGIRTVHLRIGVVLSPMGGALAKMLTPFRLGLGGRIGGGRQTMSWIAMTDLIAVMHHLITRSDLSGPVNAVAPHAVSNATFTQTLGKVLHRPTLLPLPAAMVRLLFGEMGQTLLLDGVHVKPARLLADGFSFQYGDLQTALLHELNL